MSAIADEYPELHPNCQPDAHRLPDPVTYEYSGSFPDADYYTDAHGNKDANVYHYSWTFTDEDGYQNPETDQYTEADQYSYIHAYPGSFPDADFF